MINPTLIAKDLPSLKTPEEFGFVSSVFIYLYRAPEPRPIDELSPHDCWMQREARPTRDFDRHTHFAGDSVAFVFFVQRSSLATLHPLQFQIVAFAWDFNPSVFTTFVTRGSGGGGPSDDAATLRDLRQCLLDFPNDWLFVSEETLTRKIIAHSDFPGLADELAASRNLAGERTRQ